MGLNVSQHTSTVMTGIPQCRSGAMPHAARSSLAKPVLGLKPIIAVCLLVSLALALDACTQKELVYPDEGPCRIDVRFLWDNAPEASPEGMTLLFYPLEKDGEFWRFEISGRNGGAVEITPGNYTLVALNNDLAGVRLTDMPYDAASLNVIEVPRRQDLASPAGMVYMGRIDNLEITPGRQVTCYPDSISTIFHVLVPDIKGIEKVSQASAVMEGPASGIRLSTLTPLAPPVAVAFDLQTDLHEASFAGYTSGFLAGSSPASYMLTFRVTYKGGGAYEKTYDVTDLVINYFYRHNVYIIIRGLTLPEEPTIKPDEVGIKVDVDGWKVVDIHIDSTNY